jgi:hypothetical protein
VKLAGSSSGTSVSGDGTGVLTTSPKRVSVTFYLPNFDLTDANQDIDFDAIEDIDGNMVYIKFHSALVPGLPTDKWLKSDASGGLSSLATTFDAKQLTNFGQIMNAKLKGSETIDGMLVWHITGTTLSNGTSANTDLYVRQDNYDPYKAIVHAVGTTSPETTVTFTGINTGATVDLPPADQIFVEPTP